MAQMADIPAGAGPYRVETFSPGAELIVRPFDRYWGGPPPVRRLFFRAIPQDDRRLRAINIGAVDVIDALPPNEVQALTRNPVLIPLATTSLCAMGFAFNVNHRTLSDPRVRQALNLAVPTQAIIQKLFYGFAEPLTSPLAPNAAGHITAGRTGFDLAKAKSLLTAAGWKQGDEPIRVRDGVRLSLTLLCPEGLFPADRAVAEAVATALRLVGVDVRIEGIAADTYLGRLRGDLAQAPWDLALLGFTPPQCSSVAQLQALFASASGDLKRPDGWNIGHYQSQQVDSALDRAASAPSAAARSAGLAEAQRLIWQDMPWLWLFAPANVSAVRKPVAGVEVLPTGYTSIRRSWS